MEFLDQEHEERYLSLLLRDKTHPRDKDRVAIFYIFGDMKAYIIK
ncbi:hypothetical protein [Alkalicoccus luteus]